VRLLDEVERRHRALPDRLLVIFAEVGIFIADDLAHLQDVEVLRRHLFIEQTLGHDAGVLHEGGDDLVEVLLADPFGLGAFGLGKALQFDVILARLGVDADVLAVRIIAPFPVVVSLLRALVLRREIDLGRQHLFHEKARRDGLEGVVDRVDDGVLAGIGFRDEVGEARAGLVRRVARGAADDLDDFGEAVPVSDGEGVLAPDPVEAFLRHAKRDDDVHAVAVLVGLLVLEGGHHLVAVGGTLNMDYFLITRPLARFIYRLARKACGTTGIADYRLDTLHHRSGSPMPFRKFRESLMEVVSEAQENPLPDFDIEILPAKGGEEKLRMTDRRKKLELKDAA